MITNEEDRFLKSIARDWADLSGDAGRDRQNPTMSRIEATVTAVNSDGSLTVNTSSEDSPSLKTFKRTTACDGAKVGDRVIVDTLNHISYITGVLSSGSPHYVKTGKLSMTPVAGDTVSQHIEFDEPFPAQPTVLTNPMTSVPGIVSTAAANIDENGFNLFLYRTTGTQTSVMWLAYC